LCWDQNVHTLPPQERDALNIPAASTGIQVAPEKDFNLILTRNTFQWLGE